MNNKEICQYLTELEVPHNADKTMLTAIAKRFEELNTQVQAIGKLIECIEWCDENDEPVSGYIFDALKTYRKATEVR